MARGCNKVQKRIQIGGWVTPKPAQKEGGEDYCTLEQYQLFKDSGIRAAYAIYERSAVEIDGKNANERALAHAEKVGVDFYVWDPKIAELIIEGDDEKIRAYISKYTKYKSFTGVLVKDEPNKEDYAWIKTVLDRWDTYLPGKVCYVNLFPAFADNKTCKLADDETYEKDYVGAFMQMQPKFLSYDLYPMMYDDDGNPTIQKDYLYNLELCAEQAKTANVPLWNFIQSMSYSRWHRRPDEAALRWQIMSGFAYGVKGIQHFCYWPPTEDELLTVTDAFVTPEGKPTDIYENAKKIHDEIAAFEKEYMPYAYVGVMPITGSESTEENALYATLKCPLRAHAYINTIRATQDTLCGVLENKKGKTAFFLANFADPCLYKTSEVDIHVNGVRKIKIWQNGKKQTLSVKDGAFHVTLGAGDGAFIRIVK